MFDQVGDFGSDLAVAPLTLLSLNFQSLELFHEFVGFTEKSLFGLLGFGLYKMKIRSKYFKIIELKFTVHTTLFDRARFFKTKVIK